MTENRTISPAIKGFTLVELSIVLVIISFIVGGLLSANVMIHEARINSTIVWVRSVQTGYMQFEDIYNAIPGDMNNASSYFPGATNGNGNGRVDYGNNGNGSMVYWESEDMYFWNHITSAGLLKGQLYNNVVCCPVIPGYNSPSIPLDTGLTAAVLNTFNFGAPADTLDINYPNGWYDSPGIKVRDALEIDQKIDDGLPRSGTVYALGANDYPGWAGTPAYETCYTVVNNVYQYDINSSAANRCALEFRLGGEDLQ